MLLDERQVSLELSNNDDDHADFHEAVIKEAVLLIEILVLENEMEKEEQMEKEMEKEMEMENEN